MNSPIRAANPQPLPEARPKSYVVLKSTLHCTHCSTVHETCQIMIRCEMEPRNGMGKPVTQMRSLTGNPEFRMPIEVRNIEMRVIPFCHECATATQHVEKFPEIDLHPRVAHLPLPPADDKRTLRPDEGKYGIGKQFTSDGTSTTKPAAQRKPKASTDDLLAMLD